MNDHPKAKNTRSEYVFIQHDRRYPDAYMTGDRVRVRYPSVTRPAKDQPLRGFATMVEATGKFNKTYLSLVFLRKYDGRWTSIGMGFGCPATAESLKGQLRRIRPQERERLQEIDAKLNALHEEKRAIIREAWQKAHTIQIGEVKAIAEEFHASPIPRNYEDGALTE